MDPLWGSLRYEQGVEGLEQRAGWVSRVGARAASPTVRDDFGTCNATPEKLGAVAGGHRTGAAESPCVGADGCADGWYDDQPQGFLPGGSDGSGTISSGWVRRRSISLPLFRLLSRVELTPAQPVNTLGKFETSLRQV